MSGFKYFKAENVYHSNDVSVRLLWNMSVLSEKPRADTRIGVRFSCVNHACS